MKFLADMGISPGSVLFLRHLGHDAVHLHELGLDRLPDPQILKMARDEDRVVLTHDLDFGDLMAASGDVLPSVVIFRLRNMGPLNVNRYLQSVLDQHSGDLVQGAILTVTEGHSRVRSLPIADND